MKMLALFLLFAPAAPASAQMTSEAPSGQWSSNEALGKVDFSPTPGHAIPLNLAFTDSTGRSVRLADYFHDRPVLLQLIYFRCPALCPMAQNGLLRAMRAISLSAGRDFEVLTVSIDPSDKPFEAARRRKLFASGYRRLGGEAGLNYLVGDRASIAALARGVGFRYAYDPSTDQFAHTTGVLTLTPDGRISHFLPGLELAPEDLRLGLVEASTGRIGTITDRLILLCYCYDPTKGRYGLTIMRTLQAMGVLTMLALTGAIAWMTLRSRGARRRA